MKNLMRMVTISILAVMLVSGCGTQATDDTKQQIEDIKAAMPRFAIPMREVGDRFDNMYFAALNGNWALAAYMSSYMDKSMLPVKLTRPEAYPAWTTFYTRTFDPVNKAIAVKDFAAFDKAYTAVIDSCNGCHVSMGYKFVKVLKKSEPADNHLDYNLKSEPEDLRQH